jgi:hypothetical protein
MITAAALAFAVNVANAVIRWAFGRFGKLATQVLVFVLATVAAVLWYYRLQIPGLLDLAKTVAIIFSLNVAFYEVALSRLSFFKGPAQ